MGQQSKGFRSAIVARAAPGQRSMLRWCGSVALCMLAGCASGLPSIHDDARSKQADAAVATLKTFDPAAIIATEQKAFGVRKAVDMATLDTVGKTSRDVTLSAIVRSNISESEPPDSGRPPVPRGLADYIENTLRGKLVGNWSPDGGMHMTGKSYKEIRDVLDKRSNRRVYDDAQSVVFAEYDQTFKKFNLPGPPRCPDLLVAKTAGDPIYSARVVAALNALDEKAQLAVKAPLEAMRRDYCTPKPGQVLAAAPPRVDVTRDFGTDGDLATAYNRYSEALAFQAQLEKEAADQEAAYTAAKKAYDDEVIKNAAGTSTPAKLAAALKDLQDAFANLAQNAGTENALLTQFISKERATALEGYVATVNKGLANGQVPANSSDIEKAVIVLPTLIGDAQKAIADGKQPLNLPLMIERDQDQLKSQAATLQVTALKAEVDLRRQVYESMLDEVEALSRAHDDLVAAAAAGGQSEQELGRLAFADVAAPAQPAKGADAATSKLAKPNAAAAESAKGKALTRQRLLKSAALRYLDVIGRSQPAREKLQYEIVDAQYDQGLAKDGLALQQWTSLIALTSTQVADYYQGGISVDTIIQIGQMLGLLWIGHGANK